MDIQDEATAAILRGPGKAAVLDGRKGNTGKAALTQIRTLARACRFPQTGHLFIASEDGS
jgi:hypothetical protein